MQQVGSRVLVGIVIAAALMLTACKGEEPPPPPTRHAAADKAPPVEEKAPSDKAAKEATPAKKGEPAKAKAEPEKKKEPVKSVPIKPAQAKNRSIESAEPGTPEHVLREYVIAGLMPDAAAGFEKMKELLHTIQLSESSLHTWRKMKWPYFRRKLHLYLEDDTKPVFKIAYTEEIEGGGLKVFVHNEKSMPTPCELKKDPAQENKWKIFRCSL